MRGVNKVILVGALGQDPELKTFANGGAVCNLSVATSEAWKDKQTGEPKELTEWHRVTLNDRLAEIANQYLKKGSKVYFEGSLRTRKWTDQNGQERYTTEIRANQMQMLDSRPSDGSSFPPTGNASPRANNQQSSYGQAPQAAQQNSAWSNPNTTNQQAGGYGTSNTAQQQAPAQSNEPEDDLPF